MRPLSVQVWGETACFTRPEHKVERVSYPVMTPSAARGVLEAIYWKPEFEWVVTGIDVLRPIRWHSFTRNEVNRRATGSVGFVASAARTQRHTVALRDVAYVIRAWQEPRPHEKEGVVRHRDVFRRRVERGRCFHRPYLGCREFAAHFGPAVTGNAHPIDETVDLGPMLLDLNYDPDGSGRGTPVFFDAMLQEGTLVEARSSRLPRRPLSRKV
ncbi:MAG: type I-C CRISPR-associated protein Cas5c [Gammaproteobacteria bacterium]|nr:type I-C CRISPR-associated protein Cas5c [Gammaproteobacteria bacterium]MDE0260012.1 type I-C CRISPR-associated protein Cas5c [Gammaproteobacteria bacterium]